jgi:C-terminal processing protease CtpA/Prc
LPVPLVVLTDDFTVSAAETATMALRALPGTVQIGQPTRGVLSDRLEKVLPNGWTFSLSNEVYMDPKGKIFEGAGVPPDQISPPTSPTDPDSVRFEQDIRAGMTALDHVVRGPAQQ